MTKACDARQDLVCRLLLEKKIRPLIGEVEVAADGRLELASAAVDTPPQLLLSQRGEPALHEIHPGPTGRREVDVKPRMPEHPAMNHRRLVRARVVDDQMDVEILRHCAVEGHQEVPKLPRAVALMKFSDDF